MPNAGSGGNADAATGKQDFRGLGFRGLGFKGLGFGVRGVVLRVGFKV